MSKIECRGYAGTIPVYCSHDKIVQIHEVKPNPKNPNQHPEEQIDLLAKIIQVQGWRKPITVSTRSGLVVSGHGRLMAAQFAGFTHVPVDFQHYDSEETELADLLADNRIAELAEIDEKMLAEVFAAIEPGSIDISLTGYTEDEAEKICEALSDALMLDIDEVKSKSEVSTHKLKIDRTQLELTEDEYEMLMEELNNYIDINGTTFGFVRWLLNDD